MNCPSTNKKTGFTLIELLITTALTVMLMLTITTMFMTFLIGNSKTNVRTSLKEEGLAALSQMEFNIKNALYYDESFAACTNNLNSIQIVNLDGGLTQYYIDSNKIASGSGTPNPDYLTSSSVNVDSLNFNCSGNAGNRVIKVDFTLSKAAPTLSEDDNLSETFSATINMRN